MNSPTHKRARFTLSAINDSDFDAFLADNGLKMRPVKSPPAFSFFAATAIQLLRTDHPAYFDCTDLTEIQERLLEQAADYLETMRHGDEGPYTEIADSAMRNGC
eukprot:GEZU01020509.1.p1 GENE.GEZU01020509.1~~GEZU01020509.1.p1  ORF type:complete len:104 (+),score=9.06 GEZU01020509.1:27-338(+)